MENFGVDGSKPMENVHALFGATVLPVVRRVEMDFVAEGQFGDVLQGEIQSLRFGHTSFTISCVLRCIEARVHAQRRVGQEVLRSNVVMTCFDVKARQRVEVPPLVKRLATAQ